MCKFYNSEDNGFLTPVKKDRKPGRTKKVMKKRPQRAQSNLRIEKKLSKNERVGQGSAFDGSYDL